MQSPNPKMLILARESRGLTQKEVADLLPNLNQSNYSKMEKGLLNISDEHLDNLSSIFDYPKSFFFKNSVSTPISSFYYRKRASTAKRPLYAIEAKFDIFRTIIDELCDSVDLPEFNLPTFDPLIGFTPEDVARKMREFLSISSGPIRYLIQTIESRGVIVYFIDSELEKFDGITLVTDNGHPIIFVNDNMPNDRKRFTIAHELGHLVMHIPFPGEVFEHVEKEADRFASEFLVPERECYADLKNLRLSNLNFLKEYWLVSKACLLYKAKSLGLITEGRYINYNIELSRLGEKKNENGFVPLEEPQLFRLAIKTHKEDLGYTDEELQKIFSVNRNDYNYFLKTLKTDILVKPKIIPFTPKQFS